VVDNRRLSNLHSEIQRAGWNRLSKKRRCPDRKAGDKGKCKLMLSPPFRRSKRRKGAQHGYKSEFKGAHKVPPDPCEG